MRFRTMVLIDDLRFDLIAFNSDIFRKIRTEIVPADATGLVRQLIIDSLQNDSSNSDYQLPLASPHSGTLPNVILSQSTSTDLFSSPYWKIRTEAGGTSCPFQRPRHEAFHSHMR